MPRSEGRAICTTSTSGRTSTSAQTRTSPSVRTPLSRVAFSLGSTSETRRHPTDRRSTYKPGASSRTSSGILETITDDDTEVNATPTQVSLRWLMEREFLCVPIIGALTVEQMEENAPAADVSLFADQIERIDEAY
ncbi:aldo/keto reductase [Halobacteria archaeon AArc-m2/3/4]|uniref:Aldo/keto reductase n=1 Tax=Natronoglomus mannanivorans TaxID=2979990 RepID=A0AAP3E594_9EURY|nr:aldo/keto reductase [Halobacteria archaeon AArc-xg1-1]MCU4975997.1 aldo/keto reductase [Halobacteria archaeon AArc-m2/3/4]